MSEALAAFLLLGGSFFMLVASIGLLRLPDVYCRMHAATKSTTFGMGGILLGASLIFQDATVTTQALLAVFFLFLTAPVAAHLISRAAYKRGPDLCAETTHDEYGKYLEGQKNRRKNLGQVWGRIAKHRKLEAATLFISLLSIHREERGS